MNAWVFSFGVTSQLGNVRRNPPRRYAASSSMSNQPE
jgi:hypothetical protein